MPEIDYRRQFAPQHQLVQQRRRGESGFDLARQVALVALAIICPQQQPALVDRAARDAELAPRQVGRRDDTGVGPDHDRAGSGRVRVKHVVGAVPASPRDPDEIGHDHVHRARLQRDRGRVFRPEAGHLELETVLAIEPVLANDVEFPVDRAELEYADPQRRRGRSGVPAAGEKHRQQCRGKPVYEMHLSLHECATSRVPAGNPTARRTRTASPRPPPRPWPRR